MSSLARFRNLRRRLSSMSLKECQSGRVRCIGSMNSENLPAQVAVLECRGGGESEQYLSTARLGFLMVCS
jgi:hypothetical protein